MLFCKSVEDLKANIVPGSFVLVTNVTKPCYEEPVQCSAYFLAAGFSSFLAAAGAAAAAAGAAAPAAGAAAPVVGAAPTAVVVVAAASASRVVLTVITAALAGSKNLSLSFF